MRQGDTVVGTRLSDHPHTRRFLTGVLLNSIGSGLTLPVIVVYLNQVLGLPISVASLVLSWTAVTGLVAAPIVGSVIDRIGPRPVLLAGAAVKAGGMLLWPLADSALSAFAVATVVAFGDAAIWPPQTTMMARMVPANQRQRFFGMQFMMLNLGLGAGGMISSFIVDVRNPATFDQLFQLDALSYAVYLVFIVSLRGIGGRLSDEERGARHSGSYREVFADRRMVKFTALSILILGCGYASIDAGLPAMLTTVGGLDVRQMGPVWAVNTTLIVILQLVVLSRIAGRSRTRLLAVACLLWSTSWLLVACGVARPGATFVLACVAIGVFAVGETLWSPIGAALQNDIAPEHLRGRYNAMGAVSWVVAGALGPAYSGAMLQAGLAQLWMASLVLTLALASVLAVRLGRELTAVEDGRVPALNN